jgi:CubicO group peptidase (beta-lactamase class C family)
VVNRAIGHARGNGPEDSPRKLLELDRVNDREFLCDAICQAKPLKPGTLLAYHAISGGFILGEIVQRVTGKTSREVLAEENPRPRSASNGELRRGA